LRRSISALKCRFSLARKDLLSSVWHAVPTINSAWIRGSTDEAHIVQDGKYWLPIFKMISSLSKKFTGLVELAIGDNWIYPKWNFKWTELLLRSELLKSSAKRLQVLHVCEVPTTSAKTFSDAMVQFLPHASNLRDLILFRVTLDDAACAEIVSSPLPSIRKLLLYSCRCVSAAPDQLASRQFFKSVLQASWAPQLTHLSLDVKVLRTNFLEIVVSHVLPNLTYFNLPVVVDPRSWLLAASTSAETDSLQKTGYSGQVLSFGGISFIEMRERKFFWQNRHERSNPDIFKFYSMPYQDISIVFGDTKKWLQSLPRHLSSHQRLGILAKSSISPEDLPIFLDALAPHGRMALFLPEDILKKNYAIEIIKNPSLASRLGVDFLATDSSGCLVVHQHRYSFDMIRLMLECVPVDQATKLLMTPGDKKPCLLEYATWAPDEFVKILHLVEYQVPGDEERIKTLLRNLSRANLVEVLNQAPAWIKSPEIMLDLQMIHLFFGWENARYASPATMLIRFVASEFCPGSPERLQGVVKAMISCSKRLMHLPNYYGRQPGYRAFSAIRSYLGPHVNDVDSLIQQELEPHQFKTLLEYEKKS
jgi:hypothetical protein